MPLTNSGKNFPIFRLSGRSDHLIFILKVGFIYAENTDVQNVSILTFFKRLACGSR